MPFVNSQGPLPGIDLSPVDVFLLPTPVGPIPTPAPNISLRATEIPSNFNVLISCLPSHDIMDCTGVSMGGVGPGVVSMLMCGPSRNILGSFKLLIGFMPATRALMDPTGQNGAIPNSVGMTIAPTQIRLINPT